jgi:hypothetical protein
MGSSKEGERMMAKTYRVSATCYSTCEQRRQHLGLTEFGGFARGIGEKDFVTPFRGIARKLCLSFNWEYFENLLNSMTPHPLGEKAIGKIETELWEQDEDGDRIIATYVIYECFLWRRK